MAFSAIISVWQTSSDRYSLLRVEQNPAGTDITIGGEISPTLKSEMRAVLLQMCDGTNTIAGRASILLDAIDDMVVTDLDDNVIASQATISDANRVITLSVAGSVTRTYKTVRLVMPQTLVGIYAGTSVGSAGDILFQTGVVPGTYTNATITVRADGRIAVANSNAVNGVLGPGSITESYLGAGAVSTAKLADAAVTDAKIDSVAASKVTGLAPAATSGSYTDLTDVPDLTQYLTTSSVLGESNLGSSAVTSAKISDGAVTNAKLADGAVSSAKISGVAAAKVAGLSPVATSGAYSDLTGTPDLSTFLTVGTASSTFALASDVAAVQQGVFYKQACATRVASVAAATTYLASNQTARVLVDSGAAAVDNGIYVYDASAGYKRASDFDGDPVSEISPGAMVYVVDAGVAYICNSAAAPTVVGGAITSTTSWAIYSKAEVITASNGITRSGNAFSLDTTAATFRNAVPYDMMMDYSGRPALNETMVEVTIPRAITFGAPAAHYVKTLASGERPASNNGSVLSVYRNATIILTISYQTNGTAVVAEPGGTSRAFSAGDSFKVVCTTYDATAKNHKVTFNASLT